MPQRAASAHSTPSLLLQQAVVVGLGVDVRELDRQGAEVFDAGVGEVPREGRQRDAGGRLLGDLEVRRDRGADRLLVAGRPVEGLSRP